jgi:hypothetical protein
LCLPAVEIILEDSSNLQILFQKVFIFQLNAIAFNNILIKKTFIMKNICQKTSIQRVVMAFLLLFFTTFTIMAQVPWPKTDPNNIALYKPARQSSTFEAGHANRALDGNTSGDWWKRTVTHTNETENPWWEVDLLQEYDISAITIYNRTDGATDRLKDFTIKVTSESFNDNNDGVVFVDRQANFTNSKTINGNKRGQYIRIYLNQRGILSLAEVVVNGKAVKQVMPDSDDNLALGKPARQSGDFDFSTANRANDGDTDGQSNSGSISHTEGVNKAYWEVDLGKNYLIENVRIFNRTDCCQDRLNDFNIWVTNKPKDQNNRNMIPFAANEKKFTELSKNFSGKKIGRYVRVELNGNNFLNLAEVQVFGSEAGDAFIDRPSTAVLYQVAVFRNFSNEPSDVTSEITKSIEQGMDFSRKKSDTHNSYWDLSATAKVSAKFSVVDVETSVTAGGGGGTTNTTDNTNSSTLKEIDIDKTTVKQTVPPKSVRYEFRKFVLNQSAVVYTFGSEQYSWFRVDKDATAVGDITVFILPTDQDTTANMSDDNWVSSDKFNSFMAQWGAFKKPN